MTVTLWISGSESDVGSPKMKPLNDNVFSIDFQALSYRYCS